MCVRVVYGAVVGCGYGGGSLVEREREGEGCRHGWLSGQGSKGVRE
jgi:hypothetical protein